MTGFKRAGSSPQCQRTNLGGWGWNCLIGITENACAKILLDHMKKLKIYKLMLVQTLNLPPPHPSFFHRFWWAMTEYVCAKCKLRQTKNGEMTKIARRENDPRPQQKAALWVNINACANFYHDRTNNVGCGNWQKQLHTQIKLGILVPTGHTLRWTRIRPIPVDGGRT